MYFDDLLKKIKTYESNDRRAHNIADLFMSVSPDFADVIEKWVYGKETEYEYKGITLDLICQKESCSYFGALSRMAILLKNDDLANGYLKWVPINYDWGR